MEQVAVHVSLGNLCFVQLAYRVSQELHLPLHIYSHNGPMAHQARYIEKIAKDVDPSLRPDLRGLSEDQEQSAVTAVASAVRQRGLESNNVFGSPICCGNPWNGQNFEDGPRCCQRCDWFRGYILPPPTLELELTSSSSRVCALHSACAEQCWRYACVKTRICTGATVAI